MTEPTIERYQFFIEGMHCASCVARVGQAIQSVPGVASVAVNLATRRARVRSIGSAVLGPELERAVQAAGYSARRAEAGA